MTSICGHCRRPIAACVAEPCPARAFDNEAEAAWERFESGYRARQLGQPRPAGKEEAEGWDDADRARRVRVVMPARPEGYYHAPLGTFE